MKFVAVFSSLANVVKLFIKYSKDFVYEIFDALHFTHGTLVIIIIR